MIRTWMYWDSNGFGLRWTEGEGSADLVTALPEYSSDERLVTIEPYPVVQWRDRDAAVLSLPALLDRVHAHRATTDLRWEES